MRYLVTGGAGFIGSNTVDELVRRGHDVVVLDDLSSGKIENLARVKARIEFIQHSITVLESVREACRGMDYVDGTLKVLLAARDAKVKRVVFAGSSSVYGETPTLPKREIMPPLPISPYGLSKLTGEMYGQVFQRVYGLEFVSL